MAEYTSSHNSYAAYAYPQGDAPSHFNTSQGHPHHVVHHPYGHHQPYSGGHHHAQHSQVTSHHAAPQHPPQQQAAHNYQSNYHQPYYHPQGAPPYTHQPHTPQQQQHRPAAQAASNLTAPPPQPHPYNVKHQQYQNNNSNNVALPHSPYTAACCTSAAGGSSGSAGRRGSSCSLTESEWTTGSSSPFTPPRTPSPSAPTATTPVAGSCSYTGHYQGSNPVTPTSGVVTAHNPYALTGPIPVDPPSPTFAMPMMNGCSPAHPSLSRPTHRKGHHYPPSGVQGAHTHNYHTQPQQQQQSQHAAKGMLYNNNQANLIESQQQLSLPPTRKYNQRSFGAPQPHNTTPSLASALPSAPAARPPAPPSAATIPQTPTSTPAAVAPASTTSLSTPSSTHSSSFVACPQSTAHASNAPNEGGVEERKDLRRYESLARDPNVRSRFDFLYAMLAGRLVELQLKDGTRYQGIFHSKVPREFSLKLMQVRLVTCSVYGPTSHSRPRTSLRVNDCDIAYLHAIEVPHDEEGYEELL